MKQKSPTTSVPELTRQDFSTAGAMMALVGRGVVGNLIPEILVLTGRVQSQ